MQRSRQQLAQACLSSGNCHDKLGLGLAELQSLAWSYYHGTGPFDLNVLGFLSSIWDNFDEVAFTCAPALLQAQLLKAEERALVGPSEVDHFMSRYAEIMQEAVKRGRLSAGDFGDWPLELGLQRVQQVREDVAQEAFQKPATVDMVMNFCSIRDRHGVEQKLSWLAKQPLQSLLKDAGVRLVLYLVEQPHCDTSHEQFEYLKSTIGGAQLVHYNGSDKREEQSAYFKYLADNFDNLPDFVIFVHPDAPEHQGDEFAAFRRALKLLQTRSVLAYRSLQYFPLALQLIKNPNRTNFEGHVSSDSGVVETWSTFWKDLFSLPNAICLLEAAWHVLFGEPLKTLPRESNPAVPLALKWSVPTITSYGTLGVI